MKITVKDYRTPITKELEAAAREKAVELLNALTDEALHVQHNSDLTLSDATLDLLDSLGLIDENGMVKLTKKEEKFYIHFQDEDLEEAIELHEAPFKTLEDAKQTALDIYATDDVKHPFTVLDEDLDVVYRMESKQ